MPMTSGHLHECLVINIRPILSAKLGLANRAQRPTAEVNSVAVPGEPIG